MSTQPRLRLSPDEYLAIERRAGYKSEYVDGEVFALAGASEQHNLIVGNVLAGLHAQLRKRPCRVYASDMRVKVSQVGLYAYPDVAVVCGELFFDDDQKDTLLNPTVIAEVLSASTEGYDRGKKFEYYRRLQSLREYLLIAQDRCHIEHYTRQSDGQWLLAEIEEMQGAVHLPSIECDLRLAEIYEKVEWT